VDPAHPGRVTRPVEVEWPGALLRIDPTALTDGTVEDRPYWEDVIADIWVGDYSAD
jgi:hypothetical protein